MTEAEWPTCPNPRRLLDYLRRHQVRVSVRKLTLFACACDRQIWDLLSDDRRLLAASAERRADREADSAAPVDAPPEPDAATSDDAYRARMVETFGIDVLTDLRPPDLPPRNDRVDAYRAAAKAAEEAALTACLGARGRARALQAARREQAALVRDLVGNPFRPVAFDPRWRTADVVGLARTIYGDRAFDRLPILAAALMDAGCADEQVLGHCREAGPHARGCWVVDTILDRH
jgi:hypothetical protein